MKKHVIWDGFYKVFPYKIAGSVRLIKKMTKISGFSLRYIFSQNLFSIKNFTISRRSWVFRGEISKRGPIGGIPRINFKIMVQNFKFYKNPAFRRIFCNFSTVFEGVILVFLFYFMDFFKTFEF